MEKSLIQDKLGSLTSRNLKKKKVKKSSFFVPYEVYLFLPACANPIGYVVIQNNAQQLKHLKYCRFWVNKPSLSLSLELKWKVLKITIRQIMQNRTEMSENIDGCLDNSTTKVPIILIHRNINARRVKTLDCSFPLLDEISIEWNGGFERLMTRDESFNLCSYPKITDPWKWIQHKEELIHCLLIKSLSRNHVRKFRNVPTLFEQWLSKAREWRLREFGARAAHTRSPRNMNGRNGKIQASASIPPLSTKTPSPPFRGLLNMHHLQKTSLLCPHTHPNNVFYCWKG